MMPTERAQPTAQFYCVEENVARAHDRVFFFVRIKKVHSATRENRGLIFFV